MASSLFFKTLTASAINIVTESVQRSFVHLLCLVIIDEVVRSLTLRFFHMCNVLQMKLLEPEEEVDQVVRKQCTYPLVLTSDSDTSAAALQLAAPQRAASGPFLRH